MISHKELLVKFLRHLVFFCTFGVAVVCRIRAVARFTIISISNIINFCSEQAPPRRRHITVIQTRRGKVFAEKLGSGEAQQATAFGESTSVQFIRLPRELYRLRYKRQAKHLLKSTVIQRQAILDYLVAKQRKNTCVDLSVLARVNIRRCFLLIQGITILLSIYC